MIFLFDIFFKTVKYNPHTEKYMTHKDSSRNYQSDHLGNHHPAEEIQLFPASRNTFVPLATSTKGNAVLTFNTIIYFRLFLSFVPFVFFYIWLLSRNTMDMRFDHAAAGG